MRGRVVVDQLAFANFPLFGYRFEAEAQIGRRRHEGTQSLSRFEGQWTGAYSFGPHSFSL